MLEDVERVHLLEVAEIARRVRGLRQGRDEGAAGRPVRAERLDHRVELLGAREILRVEAHQREHLGVARPAAVAVVEVSACVAAPAAASGLGAAAGVHATASAS